jgi:hypothetical protein
MTDRETNLQKSGTYLARFKTEGVLNHIGGKSLPSVELFLDPFFAKRRVRSVTTADVAEIARLLVSYPLSGKPYPRRPVEDDEPCRNLGDTGQTYQSLRGYRTLSRA